MNSSAIESTLAATCKCVTVYIIPQIESDDTNERKLITNTHITCIVGWCGVLTVSTPPLASADIYRQEANSGREIEHVLHLLPYLSTNKLLVFNHK